MIWFLPPPGWIKKTYKYRGRVDIRDPRARHYWFSEERWAAFREKRFSHEVWLNPESIRATRYHSFNEDRSTTQMIFTSNNNIVDFGSQHWWIVIFIGFVFFWLIVAFFAGYKDVWMGFMSISTGLTLFIFSWTFIKTHFLVIYFLTALVLFLTLLYLTPQFTYDYVWLGFITVCTFGAFLWGLLLPRPW